LAALALGARHQVTHRLGSRGIGSSDAFHRIRIHGDFHLGQTLRTSDGFAIIDFEGEPTKPLEARRQKQCALRDVAGMLRSIEYAVATVDAEAPTPEPAPERPVGRLRDSFLGGYRSRALAQAPVFLPPTAEASNAWLAVFELEKALYEVEYEVNNRPSWVHIPLAAVGRLLTGTP
jgi:trehalose synthase-fused probable maltokinase